MTISSRRNFLRRGSLGLAAIGVGGFMLQQSAGATPASGELAAYGDFLKEAGFPVFRRSCR